MKRQLATDKAAQELIQYRKIVLSVSSKKRDLQGAPQSFVTFPATFNSYPITCGALSCTGQMKPMER